MKKIWKYFVQTILPWAIATAGIPILIYGIWFQTEGLTLIKLEGVLLALVVGAAIGFFATRYIGQEKMTGPKDMHSLIYAYELTAVLCLLITYCASTVIMFLVGVAGSALGISAAAYYDYWFAMRNRGHIINADKDTAKQ